jgi:hypothetical protein
MPSCGLQAARFFLGAALAQIPTIPGYANAILSPTSFTSLGTFGVNGVNQYFVGETVTNGVDYPVIVDSTGQTRYTGVFIGNFFQGTQVAVFDFTSFMLNAGQTLSSTSVPNNGNLFTLPSPVALLSLSGMTIAGTITANGGNGTQGALVKNCNGCGLGGMAYAGGGQGGSVVNGASGVGGGPSGGGIGQAMNPATGGGGGGFGGGGGNGAASGDKAGGAGGAAVVAKLVDKLQGGSGGGAGGGGSANMANPAYSSGGGAGGGAIELSACCDIDITGTINVNGGSGGLGYLGAGGGGSGGGILIAADTVTIGNAGMLLANGGSGGGTGDFGTVGGGGGGGEAYIETAINGFTNDGMILLNGGPAGSPDAIAGGNGTVDTDTNFQPCPAPLIGRGLPVLLAVGGVLFGAEIVERSKKRRSLGTAIPHAAA